MRSRRGETEKADVTSLFAVNQFLRGQRRGEVDEES
jgi:hypothetical protein